jgi:hypothetical protein
MTPFRGPICRLPKMHTGISSLSERVNTPTPTPLTLSRLFEKDVRATCANSQSPKSISTLVRRNNGTRGNVASTSNSSNFLCHPAGRKNIQEVEKEMIDYGRKAKIAVSVCLTSRASTSSALVRLFPSFLCRTGTASPIANGIMLSESATARKMASFLYPRHPLEAASEPPRRSKKLLKGWVPRRFR